MLHPLPAIPAVRTFTPGHTNFSPPGTSVTEALVERLGFVPRFTPSEAYEIELDAKGVKIRALDPAGLSHARATWNQLKGQKQLPSGLIQDEPRFFFKFGANIAWNPMRPRNEKCIWMNVLNMEFIGFELGN
jgi:hypothetical protein